MEDNRSPFPYHVTYHAHRRLGGVMFAAHSEHSQERADYECYLEANMYGLWEPRSLRWYTWEIWKPTKHNAIEIKFMEKGWSHYTDKYEDGEDEDDLEQYP